MSEADNFTMLVIKVLLDAHSKENYLAPRRVRRKLEAGMNYTEMDEAEKKAFRRLVSEIARQIGWISDGRPELGVFEFDRTIRNAIGVINARRSYAESRS